MQLVLLENCQTARCTGLLVVQMNDGIRRRPDCPRCDRGTSRRRCSRPVASQKVCCIAPGLCWPDRICQSSVDADAELSDSAALVEAERAIRALVQRAARTPSPISVYCPRSSMPRVNEAAISPSRFPTPMSPVATPRPRPCRHRNLRRREADRFPHRALRLKASQAAHQPERTDEHAVIVEQFRKLA